MERSMSGFGRTIRAGSVAVAMLILLGGVSPGKGQQHSPAFTKTPIFPVGRQGECVDHTPSFGRYKSHGVEKIGTEQPGGVAERVFFHYEDPDVTMRSYSAVDVGGCSGTMIGPNVMLTAGHCGSGARNSTFRLYTTADTQITESFPCEYLLHTFSDMDLNLYFCRENTTGESPGDKYGYADFDIVVDPDSGGLDYSASENLIVNGTNVYSVWMNPIMDLGGGWHSIYSEGMITDDALSGHWGNPNLNATTDFRCGNACCNTGVSCTGNCDGGACGSACTVGQCTGRASMDRGVRTDVWSNPGASGSSQFNSASHRLLVGPLSTGSGDSRGRNAVGIVNHLYWGYTDPDLTNPTGCTPCVSQQVNEPLLLSLGIANPGDYYGYVDYIDNFEDGMLDVQQELELIQGENPRQWYWLGFESLRRNALWTKNMQGRVEFDTSDASTGIATLDTRGVAQSGYALVLSHERLNLPADRLFDLSMMTYISEGVYASAIRVCLEGMKIHCVDFDPPWFSWETNVARLRASEGAVLRIYMRPDTLLHLVAVSLIEHGALMDFDSHDKRFMWRNHNTGGRGLIWPNGINSDTQPDWAAVVYRDPLQPLDDDWSIRNRQIAINGGEQYRVCFKYRISDRDPLTAAWGVVRMLNEYGELADSKWYIAPSDTWRDTCTPSFHVPTDDNNLQFGVVAFVGTANGAYLVDNVRVFSEPLFADGFESGDTSE